MYGSQDVDSMQVDRLKSGLPFVLAGIMRSNAFPSALHRWNTNEEVVSYLISQEDHKEWLVDTIPNKSVISNRFLATQTLSKGPNTAPYFSIVEQR